MQSLYSFTLFTVIDVVTQKYLQRKRIFFFYFVVMHWNGNRKKILFFFYDIIEFNDWQMYLLGKLLYVSK